MARTGSVSIEQPSHAGSQPFTLGLQPSDPHDARWLAFVETHPEATPFHHPGWLDLLSACYGYHARILAITTPSGGFCAGLPIMEVRSVITGRRWVSLPFSDYCTPLAEDEAALNRLTETLSALANDHAVRRVDLRWSFPSCPGLKRYKAYYLHRVLLSGNKQQVGQQFDTAHRQNIRSAKRKGVHIERGTSEAHLKAYYHLQVKTRQRKGLPAQPWKFFRLIKPHLFDRGMGFVLLAYRTDKLLAGAVFLNWKNTVVAKYAASYEDALELRPNNLIFWEAIGWACEQGYQVFDMGRTELNNEGLRKFKLKWGAQETPLYYTTSGKPPGTQVTRLMPIMSAVIQRAPPWVCRRIGEVLYGHFA